MLDLVVPDLTFPKMRHTASSVPTDFRWLLFRGAAAAKRAKRDDLIASGKLGAPIPGRLPLIEAIHSVLNSLLEKGGSPASLTCQVNVVMSFYAFADQLDRTLTPTTAQALYLKWAAATAKRVKPGSAYRLATTLAACIAQPLGTTSNKLAWKTKLRKPKPGIDVSETQNLERTKSFIQTLRLICSFLPLDVVHGPLPIRLVFAERTHVLKCGLKVASESDLKVYLPAQRGAALALRERLSKDTSYRVRSPLINLRIEAELLIFINQTSANLAPCLQIIGTKFRYQTKDDYLYIRPWKARAGHKVEYRVHRAYRAHFDAYLEWRNSIFPDDPDGLLFPFLSDDGGPNGRLSLTDGPNLIARIAWDFQAMRKLLKALDIKFIGPQALRKTAGIWIERTKAGMGSQLLGNSPETFSRDYDQPNHQRAMVDVTNFWRDAEKALSATGPGLCVEVSPQMIENAPENAPTPDCVSGSGCLFCEHNRDQHSFDHAWKLTSLRALLLRQLSEDRSPESQAASHPTMVKIDRIAAKLDAFSLVDGEHGNWVREAEERIDESHFHTYYSHKFLVMERRHQ